MPHEKGNYKKAISTRSEEPEKENLKQRTIRIADRDWKILERHFREMGIPTTTGIRMVLRKYITDSTA